MTPVLVAAAASAAAAALIGTPPARMPPPTGLRAAASTRRGDDPRRSVGRAVRGLVLGALVAAVVGGWLGALAGVLVGALTLRRGRTEGPESDPDLPVLVALVLACLESGAPPHHALRTAAAALPGPSSHDLAAAADRLDVGDDPARVWAGLAGHPRVGDLGVALARAHDTGGSVSTAVGRLATDLERRRRSLTEQRARSVGVRAAVPLGVCLLPAFLLLGVVPLAAGLLAVVGGT